MTSKNQRRKHEGSTLQALWEGNSPVTRGFPLQMDIKGESVLHQTVICLGEKIAPIGLETGGISILQISAKNSAPGYSEDQLPLWTHRSLTGGGMWMPQSDETSPWIHVYLWKKYFIKRLLVQGGVIYNECYVKTMEIKKGPSTDMQPVSQDSTNVSA